MRRVALAIAALLVLLSNAPAAAQPQGNQVTFGVRPAGEKAPDNRARFTYGATPGAVVRDFLAVSNIGTSPLTLRVYASDAFNTQEGGFDLLAGNRPPVDVGAWTKPGMDSVTVAPRSFAIVPFTVTVPGNATPGDHTGGIVASLSTARTDAQGNKVAVDQRVGARIYLRVSGDLHPQLAVEALTGGYRTNWNPFGHGSATVTYQVRNIGNIVLQGKQKVTVSTPWGSTADAPALPDLPELLPGNAIPVTVRLPAVLPGGWLTATVHVEPKAAAGDPNPPPAAFDSDATFAAVPWVFVIVLLLILGVVLFLLWRRRRRAYSSTSDSEAKVDATVG
jgi:hypothetical protein